MRKTATNQFGDGLVTDFHPLTAKNTTLVDALNATLVTAKGNEMILQNDAGNIQIKTGEVNDKGEPKYVQLTEGFIPIGIKEYNGILYIISYDPSEGFGEIGSYPSPDYSQLGQNENRVDLLYKYQPLYNYKKNNEVISFTTSNLNFDLTHPVDIEIQPSYDGSVNLIFTDDKNIPRLINSAFSVTENGKAFRAKRHNNKDNIYEDEKFDLQTSLIKRITKKK